MILCHTLGPVEVTLDGGPAPAELLWRKNLAMLIYLARSPRRTRSRDHLVGLLWGLVHYVELMTSEFAVTTSRLIFKVGLISRYTTELLLAKVESIGVQQGLLGRLLNYGDLTVTGTGGAREVFRRVGDPIGFRNHVQQASLGSGSTQA